MKTVFWDNHLLIVVKDVEVCTQSNGEGESVEELAKAWVKERFHKPGRVFLEPIHRLDKPVGGLVLFARTSKALSRLQESMRQQQIEKTYFACVEGMLPEGEQKLEHLLVHGDHKAYVASPSQEEGKRALLYYKVLSHHHKNSLVEIRLVTGRYHQIRAQFAAIGCPVIGDKKYGSRIPSPTGSPLLHHGRLRFSHPVSKEPLCFECLPHWFKAFS